MRLDPLSRGSLAFAMVGHRAALFDATADWAASAGILNSSEEEIIELFSHQALCCMNPRIPLSSQTSHSVEKSKSSVRRTRMKREDKKACSQKVIEWPSQGPEYIAMSAFTSLHHPAI